MAMVAAGIANGGTVMKPYLVDEEQSADLDVLEQDRPGGALPGGLGDDGQRGHQADGRRPSTTAPRRPAAIPGISVAGKTGTAQTGHRRRPAVRLVHLLRPGRQPEVAVAVMIQNADIPRGEIAGGLLGGPIAKAVMEAVIK